MKPGVKFMDLFCLKNIRETTLFTHGKDSREGAVIEKKVPELFINGKDTMAVRDINKFKGHRGSTIHGIFISTGRGRNGCGSGKDKFQLTAEGHPYMAPPKEGSPQLIILSIFSTSVFLGREYI